MEARQERRSVVASGKTVEEAIVNGLAMLVHQGAIGFEMWTGLPAPQQVMRDALRKAFGAY